MKPVKNMFLGIFAVIASILFTLYFILDLFAENNKFYLSEDYVAPPLEDIVDKSKYLIDEQPVQSKPIQPVIISLRGTELSVYEEILLEKLNPFGVALQSYNISSVEQMSKLRKSIEDIIGRKIIFFADQEGGRVNRIKNVYKNSKFPSPYYYNNIATTDINESKKLVFADAVETAKKLKELGIDVNMGLMLDTLLTDSMASLKKNKNDPINAKHDIGDRSYSSDPVVVKNLAFEYIKAFNQEGVELCAKHFLGLGSALNNTHYDVAVIDKDFEKLKKEDLLPFYNLKNVSYGMVSHAVYPAIDPDNILGYSKKGIDFIRNELGFQGILISDGLNMGGAGGISLKEKVDKSFAAGIDLVLPMYVIEDERNLKEYLRSFTVEGGINGNKKLEKMIQYYREM